MQSATPNAPVRLRGHPVVVRVPRFRSPRAGRWKVPAAAIYTPASKWPVVTAFMVAIALHFGAVLYFEPKPLAIASNDSKPENVLTQIPTAEPSGRIVPD